MARKPSLPVGATPACTCLLLRKAARRVSQIYDQHLAEHGLTITQFGLLAHIEGLGAITIGALADRLIMDPTTLSRNLRPLERRGLVASAPDQRDRRARSLSLTAAGRRALAKARPAWQSAERHVREVLGESDRAALGSAIGRMLETLAP